MKSSLFIIVLLAALILMANAQSPTMNVTTSLGSIIGHLAPGHSGYEFRGIRHVNPYTRWTHSTLANKPFGIFDASTDVPGCPQECKLPPHTCPMKYSELDCLGLNVFTPLDISGNPRPVMVYFPGGNYFQGGNDTPLYNGTTIANIGNVIVVVVNYRLGITGFYRDDENGIYGNYGMVDQLNALKWVKQHISRFGGDANNVTIFGQSAGGGSTAVHLTSTYSKGLYNKAIIHSNPFVIPFRSIKTKAGLVKAYRKNSGCLDRTCLLNLSTAALLEAQVKTATDLDAASGNMLSVFIPFNPYVETPGQEPQDPEYPGLVPYQPQEAWLRGLVNNVPIMIGAVKQESDVFIYEAFESPLDDTGYALFGWLIFGDEKNKRIQARYPPIKGADNRDGLCTIGSEFIFHCSLRNATRGAITTSVKQPLYTYVFDHVYKFGGDMWGPDFPVCSGDATAPARVCHAGELPALWNSAQWMFDYSPQDQALANTMGYYWTNFAWSGNPNQGPNSSMIPVNWEPYSASGRSMYLESPAVHMVSDFMGEACAFWDSIGYFL